MTKSDSFKDCKVRQSWIANYYRFWNTNCDKTFKNWIAKCNEITKFSKIYKNTFIYGTPPMVATSVHQ